MLFSSELKVKSYLRNMLAKVKVNIKGNTKSIDAGIVKGLNDQLYQKQLRDLVK